MKQLFIFYIFFCCGCQYLSKIQINGEVIGTRYSNQQFTKGKHVITARYPLSETMNIKGTVSQEYKTGPLIQTEMPDYGETSLEILF
jgi:hypothetical protein